MAISIHSDLVAQHGYREDDRTGSLTRCFRVDGLTPGTDITEQAIRAQEGAEVIPQAGQFHPSLNQMVVRAIEVQGIAQCRTGCRLFVHYVKIRRRLLDIIVNGASMMQHTSYDREGNLIVVGYKPGSNEPYPSGATSENRKTHDYSTGSVPKLLPDTTLDFSYLEAENPLEKAGPFIRKLNSKRWQGGEPREWFCSDVLARVESPIPLNIAEIGNPEVVDGSSNMVVKFMWHATYRFRKRNAKIAEGWDPVVPFVSLLTGETPKDVNPKTQGWPTTKRGNGWGVFEIYDEADFDLFNLPKLFD